VLSRTGHSHHLLSHHCARVVCRRSTNTCGCQRRTLACTLCMYPSPPRAVWPAPKRFFVTRASQPGHSKHALTKASTGTSAVTCLPYPPHPHTHPIPLPPASPPHSPPVSASALLSANAFTKKRAARSSIEVDGTSSGMTSKPCRSQRSSQSCSTATQPTMSLTSTTSRRAASPLDGTAHRSH